MSKSTDVTSTSRFLEDEKMPKRFETGNTPSDYPATVKDMYRQQYDEALDLATASISDRYRTYQHLGDMVVKAVTGTSGYEEYMKHVIDFYATDIQKSLLTTQRDALRVHVKKNNISVNKLSDVIMSTYQFLYYNLRGRGQAIRYLLLDNKIPYEEIDICPDYDTWLSKYKPQMPFGQVPLLKDGDFELAQFNAILRYLGRKHGLHPADPREAGKLDMISDHIEDIRCQYVNLIYGDYDNKKSAYIEALGEKLQPIENLLKKWGNKYITSEIAFADYNLLDMLEIHEILAPGCLDNFPTLQEFVRTMQARAGIQAFQQTDGFKNMKVNYNDNK